MSKASRRAASRIPDRAERLQSRIAALLTALVHLLLLLLVMLAPPIVPPTNPQGGDAGGRMDVTYIDKALDVPPPPVRAPVVRKTPPRQPRKVAPAASRLQTTRVDKADDAAPLQVVDIPDNASTAAAKPPLPPGEPAATPPVPDRAARPPRAWGLPPGMLPQGAAAVDAGRARSPAIARGRGNEAAASGTSMEVGGYQVYYGLVDEARLRAWQDRGMTELFIPLPGTRRLMVCPLDIALRRESGACRLMEPDDPGLEAIGDARDVITMERIYRLGEVLWSGPGSYR